MARVVYSVFGSAGDVFPCIAVARAQADAGHQVSFVVPRWLGLYTRSAGLRTLAVGAGEEGRALEDSNMYTARFGGMSSWRRSMADYVFPLLAEHYPRARALLAGEAPDVVVTTAQGYWGALAATELGVPWSSLHLYPQLSDLSASGRARGARRFGGALARWLADEERRLGVGPTRLPVVEWSVSPRRTALAHDPAVLEAVASGAGCPLARRGGTGVPMVARAAATGPAAPGFPYWDGALADPGAVSRARDFLSRPGYSGKGAGSGAAVVVALGTFLGLRSGEFWCTFARAARRSPHRFLLVGVGRRERERLSSGNVLALGHLPLSEVLGCADLFVHHGGIGSMYAGLHAGLPALVFPMAFDQPYNASLLERLGVGRPLGRDPAHWMALVDATVADGEMATRARRLAARLVPPTEAASTLADALVDLTPS